MIEFSYQRETLPELLGWEFSRDPSLATRGELLWYFFPAGIVLRSEGRVIETRHAGIPLLHFVLEMIRIANELLSADSGESHYAFTESDEDLVFIRRPFGSGLKTDLHHTPGRNTFVQQSIRYQGNVRYQRGGDGRKYLHVSVPLSVNGHAGTQTWITGRGLLTHSEFRRALRY